MFSNDTKNRHQLRYIIYARKSSEDEDRQVQSIPDQISYWTNRASREGFCIIGAPLEESRSAKVAGNRPVFTQMIEMLQRGEADGILCWQVNRLSRNPEEAGLLMGMLQRNEIKSIISSDRS